MRTRLERQIACICECGPSHKDGRSPRSLRGENSAPDTAPRYCEMLPKSECIHILILRTYLFPTVICSIHSYYSLQRR